MSIIFITKFPDIEQRGFNVKEYYRSYLTSNVVISASAKNVYYPVNTGGPLSVKYVFKGEEYYVNHCCKYRVKSDTYIVFNEQQSYGSYIDSEETTESFSVFFKPDYIREVLSSLITLKDRILENPFYPKKSQQPVNFIERLYPRDDYIVPILARLKCEIENKNFSETYYSEQLYFLLEGLIYSNRGLYKEIEKVKSVKKSTRLEIYRRLCTAKDYIDSCYNEKITLQTLAKASSMCKYHLLREFKKYYRQTPYRYLTERRLDASKSLLADSTKSITEISRLTGFEYLSSFSEAFYKHSGITPTSFRKSALKSC